MIIDSNSDQLNRDIGALLGSFDFELSVANMSLGKRMAEKAAEAIQSRSIQFQKGAAQQWDENKEPYKTWKATKYGVHDLAGVRTGQMLSQESLRGETEVGPDEVAMVYGTNTTPTRSSGSGYISEGDKKVTDRQKAGWFTDGGPDRAARPFYELDEDVADQVFEVVVEAFDKMMGG